MRTYFYFAFALIFLIVLANDKAVCGERENNTFPIEISFNETGIDILFLHQRDTTKRTRREEPKTTRVPKNEPTTRTTSTESADEDDSILGSCFSGCLSSIITNLFSSSEDSEEPTIAKREEESREKIKREIPKSDTSYYRDVELKPLPRVTLESLRDTTKTEFQKEEQTRDTLTAQPINITPPQNIYVEPVPKVKADAPTQNYYEPNYIEDKSGNSLWYLGFSFGAGTTFSSENHEYETGLLPRIYGGIFIQHRFQILGFAEYGWYDGKPKLDYVTTTNLSSGDEEVVKEIPQKSWLRFFSFGIGTRYVTILNPNSDEGFYCLGIGGEIRYMSFFEKAELLREEYLNDIHQKSFKHTVSQNFNKPTWAVNVSYIYLPSYLPSWMFDLTICYNGIHKKPTENLPLSTEWDGLARQLIFSIGVKINIYEIE
ncbi:MAG: hypothetical protein QME58_12130 [Bacteroidota bacterium]|nr:hypothetical protein [Bacteroidota bacterium]